MYGRDRERRIFPLTRPVVYVNDIVIKSRENICHGDRWLLFEKKVNGTKTKKKKKTNKTFRTRFACSR